MKPTFTPIAITLLSALAIILPCQILSAQPPPLIIPEITEYSNHPSANILTLELIDVLSQNRIQIKVPANAEYQLVNCSGLTAGIYNVHVESDNLNKVAKNLVVVK